MKNLVIDDIGVLSSIILFGTALKEIGIILFIISGFSVFLNLKNYSIFTLSFRKMEW
jgi:hypothetical protein